MRRLITLITMPRVSTLKPHPGPAAALSISARRSSSTNDWSTIAVPVPPMSLPVSRHASPPCSPRSKAVADDDACEEVLTAVEVGTTFTSLCDLVITISHGRDHNHVGAADTHKPQSADSLADTHADAAKVLHRATRLPTDDSDSECIAGYPSRHSFWSGRDDHYHAADMADCCAASNGASDMRPMSQQSLNGLRVQLATHWFLSRASRRQFTSLADVKAHGGLLPAMLNSALGLYRTTLSSEDCDTVADVASNAAVNGAAAGRAEEQAEGQASHTAASAACDSAVAVAGAVAEQEQADSSAAGASTEGVKGERRLASRQSWLRRLVCCGATPVL